MATAKRATRMTRRMARIASTARGAGRITTTAAAVMYKLRNDDGLGDNVAAALAFVSFLLLAVCGIGGRTDGLRLDEFQGISTAFRAGREIGIMLSVLLHHNGMAIDTAVWREFHRPYPILGKVILGQSKHTVFPHHTATLGALTFIVGIDFFLENEVIHPTQPRRHPHGHLVGLVVCRRLIN